MYATKTANEFPDVLATFFNQFGENFLDWPHRKCCKVMAPSNGYVFVVFANEHSVRRLVDASEMRRGEYFVSIKNGRKGTKQITIDTAKFVSSHGAKLLPREIKSFSKRFQATSVDHCSISSQ
uniref:RRM domain-containing protein n=1 Tax=Elaeophora elaphi TaxID=1147741 RepID=A0A0R3RP20_9BILA